MLSLRKLCVLCLLFLTFISVTSLAEEEFVVKNIHVEGLQRVSLSTVREYLPIHEGEVLDSSKADEIIRALYTTGFFSDVRLSREGNTLIISVMERATIGLIRINGNKQVKTKDLMDVLKQAGIAEGLVFDQSTLAGMKQALEAQYFSIGRYNASVQTTVTQESRNRVSIDINICEGQIAKIKQINIIGNCVFSERTLLKNFKMTTKHLWTFITGSDDYSREKLEADLESLRSFYLNRGYLRFTIDSTQVSITPNRKDVYITIHVTEGAVYHVKGYRVTGNLLGKGDEIIKLIRVRQGQIFCRRDVQATTALISRFYQDQGYAQATVNVVPDIDDANSEVFLTFVVNPGQRVYVRRINFLGNSKTADYVLRRESRQIEGGVFSVSKIDETKRRLNNLGYLENIQVKMEPVPNQPDKLDLNYSLKETSSATASAQLGYSDNYGFTYGANIVQKNFMGTGKNVTVGFNNSQYAQNYSFNYFNPYYTDSGISRGFSAYVQRVTPAAVSLASYTQEVYGAMMNYRIPISEYDYFNFGYGYEYMNLNSSNPSTEISDFFQEHGQHFNNAKVTAGWSHNTYDRAIFPTRGFNSALWAEAGTPLLPDSLDYYKIRYDAKYYHPIVKTFILHLNGSLGYGNGYNGFDELPFFKNFYAGGIGSVRGYYGNTLGPVDSLGNHIGGNVLAYGNVNLIFPNPLGPKVRTQIFVDGGNVYQNELDLGDLRYSAGFELDWVSPMGPLQFSLAQALNPHDHDQTKFFDFSVGTSF